MSTSGGQTAPVPGYRTTVRPGVARLVRAADRVLPGTAPAAAALARRHAWGALPRRPARRPDAVARLVVSVDLDYQADTDALRPLCDLVERSGTVMSVCAVGALVDADPGPYADALERGHEIVNHSQTHPDNPVLSPDREFWHLSAEEMAQEVAVAQDVCEARLGVRPRGFRTPHFKDAHRLTAVLEDVDPISYLSSALSTRCPTGAEPYLAPREAVADEATSALLAPRDPAGASRVLQVPLTPCPEHRWSPFCTWHGIRAGAAAGSGAGMHPLPRWEALWDRMLRDAEPDGLVVVYLDPMDLMRDEETASAFGRMLDAARDAGWTSTTLGEVADAYRPLAAAGEADAGGPVADGTAG